MMDTIGREVLVEKWLGVITFTNPSTFSDYRPLEFKYKERAFVLFVQSPKLKSGERPKPLVAIVVECDDMFTAGFGEIHTLNLETEYYQEHEINKCQKLAFKIAVKLIRKGKI